MSSRFRLAILSVGLATFVLIGWPEKTPAQVRPPVPVMRLQGKLGVWGTATPAGFWINAVQPFSPARHAGLVPGDVIVRVNDRLITSEFALNRALNLAGPRARLLVRNPMTGTLRYTWVNLWR